MANSPRKSGTLVRLFEENWDKDAPFGHCPVCKNLGIEGATDGKNVHFSCSNPNCYTMRLGDDGHVVKEHTEWCEEKPQAGQ